MPLGLALASWARTSSGLRLGEGALKVAALASCAEHLDAVVVAVADVVAFERATGGIVVAAVDACPSVEVEAAAT